MTAAKPRKRSRPNEELLAQQRTANEQLVLAILKAQEVAEKAAVDKAVSDAMARRAVEVQTHLEEVNRRLAQAERELRAAAELREQFVGILGHDLKNPLGAIIIASRLLVQTGELSETQAKLLDRIGRSGQRMVGMVAQLLDFTHARLGGGLRLHAARSDLAAVCRQVAEELEGGRAAIECDLEGDLTGTWDVDRLAQALSNLIGNAIEHAHPGTAVVLRARASENSVIVEVVNHGDPISPELRPIIFDPFRRARSQDGGAKHLGLGLFVAHQVVLAHHGELHAGCEDGKTTFTIRLPRIAPSAP